MSNILDSQDPVAPVVQVPTVTLAEALVIADGTDRMHVAIYEGKPHLKCGASSEFRRMRTADYDRYFRSSLPRCKNCITRP